MVKADGGAVWNRPGAIFYTSGTTGPSKGAVVTQHYLVSAAAAALSCWGLEPGEAVWGPLPLFHLSAIGTVLAPILAGGTGVVDRAFSVQAAWDQVRRFDAAGVVLAGAMVMMLWSLPRDASDRDLPFRFLSAAPVPKEVYRGVEERYRCKVVTMYGLTEAFPLTFAGVADDNPPGASGRPNPSFEVALFDEDDAEVAAGEVGQIVCRPRGPHVMFEGYFGRDEATVRRRGENISSFEVEQALLQHPAVAEIAAIGVPSDVGEDDVMVCLVTVPGAELDPVDLLDFACDRLPYFAVPRFVEVCAELPKNAVGRVLKPVLRARGLSDTSWDRERVGYEVRR
jgi:crotonobetaine/carnitine-CoA ligase